MGSACKTSPQRGSPNISFSGQEIFSVEGEHGLFHNAGKGGVRLSPQMKSDLRDTHRSAPHNRAFIVCRRRRSEPRVSTETCLSCKHHPKCEEYGRYRTPYLFREMGTSPVRAKTRRTRPAPKPSERKGQSQEQLPLLTPTC